MTDQSTDNPNFDKYKYIIKNPLTTKLLYLCGILSWFMTLWGYYNFFQLDILYWILLFPLILIYTIYYTLSYGINLFYVKPDLKIHLEKVKFFKESKDKPFVDIFLPICGESIEIVRRTWDRVSKLDYPNFNVYVLDDKGKKEYEDLANFYNFNYLSRPNKGEMKKAGNLKYGFERSSGKYIVIFDADFAPLPEFLHETVPYQEEDETLGIVQTPQYFEIHDVVHKRSWLEFGACSTQEDFYRLIQCSRDYFKSAICVGTNAIYRRKALQTIGGTAQIEHSEDVWTGILLRNQGYELKYIPYILAEGFCPDEHNSFFKQQYRWCKGSMSLMTDPKFWKLPIGSWNKIPYISGFFYYISSFVSFFLPFTVFFVLYKHYDTISFNNSLLFLPYIVFSFIVIPLMRPHNSFKIGAYLARYSAFAAYSLAIVHTALGINMGWSPTGNAKGNNFWYHFSIYSIFAHFVAYLGMIIFMAYIDRLNFDIPELYSVNFWIIINTIMSALYLSSLLVNVFFEANAKWGKFVLKTFIPNITIFAILFGYLAFAIIDSQNNSLNAKKAVAGVVSK